MNVKNTLITNNCVVFMIVKKNIVLYNFPYMGRMQLPPVENRPPARFLRPVGSKRRKASSVGMARKACALRASHGLDILL